jgi:hypothetical protein
MYGFGNSYSKILTRLGGLNPLDIEGLNLYMNNNLGVNTKLAADFNGADQYLSSSSTDFDKFNTDFSGAGWVMADNLGRLNVLSKNDGGGTNDKSMMLQLLSGGVILYKSDNGSSFSTITIPSSYTAGNWVFIAYVFDFTNSLYKLSINGSSFTTGVLGASIHNSTSDFRVGASFSNNISFPFNGKIDSVFFYDKALSLAELQAIYNSGNGSAYNNLTDAQKVDLVSWWELNEESGIRYDEHGTNNLTDNNSTGYGIGKVQEPTEVGELVHNWIDQSPNIFIFPQDTVSNMPLLGVDSVDFDGVDDILSVSGSNLLNDSSGVLFFSFYYDGSTSQTILASADNTTNNNMIAFQAVASKIKLLTINGVPLVDTLQSTDNLVIGYNHAYIGSTGLTTFMSLNGVAQVVQVIAGVNQGSFFASISGRDNLTISGANRLNPFVNANKNNKIIYSNANLSDSVKSKIDNFMSDPNN